MNLRRLISDCIPPILRHIVAPPQPRCIWQGAYADWDAAKRASTGYDDDAIVGHIEAAVRKVLAGSAAFERDGMTFAHPEQRWNLLAAWALASATVGDRPVRVLDVGGSLGSAWLQHRSILATRTTDWTIVEQPAFVSCGRRLFPDTGPRFCTSIAEALRDGPPDLVLASSVLQYVADPDALVHALASTGSPWLLIDRTPEHPTMTDRIAVQRVPAGIYPASYPCRIFAAGRIPKLLAGRYALLAEGWDGIDSAPGMSFRSWLLQRHTPVGQAHA